MGVRMRAGGRRGGGGTILATCWIRKQQGTTRAPCASGREASKVAKMEKALALLEARLETEASAVAKEQASPPPATNSATVLRPPLGPVPLSQCGA